MVLISTFLDKHFKCKRYETHSFKQIDLKGNIRGRFETLNIIRTSYSDKNLNSNIVATFYAYRMNECKSILLKMK